MLIKGRILIGHAISNDTDVRILANVRSLSSHRHLDRRSSSSPILVPTPATQQSTLLSRASQRPSDQVSRHSPSSSSALTFKAASTAPCVSLFLLSLPAAYISNLPDRRCARNDGNLPFAEDGMGGRPSHAHETHPRHFFDSLSRLARPLHHLHDGRQEVRQAQDARTGRDVAACEARGRGGGSGGDGIGGGGAGVEGEEEEKEGGG